MLFQEIDWSRIFIVFIIQLLIGSVFIVLSIKVLRRHLTKISMICSGIFIPIALAFIFNLIYLPLTVNPTVYILHVTSIYLLHVAQIFILLFNLNLLKSKFELTIKKQIIIFIIYATGFLILLFIPGAIIISEETNWRPMWNIYFSIALLTITTIAFIIPSALFSIRIYKSFEEIPVKKKWRYYMLGYIGLAFSYYSLIFYNTFTDPLMRLIFSVITAVVLVPSGFLMYLGIGKQLQK